jgi:RNA polymerase sigma-70 factor (ECF subfamily)
LARSRALDFLRRRRRQAEKPAPPQATQPADPAALLEEKDTGRQVREALGQLNEDQRSAIVLAFYSGLTHEEVAARQAAPLGTVKTRIRLGMQRLRSLLTEKATVSA